MEYQHSVVRKISSVCGHFNKRWLTYFGWQVFGQYWNCKDGVEFPHPPLFGIVENSPMELGWDFWISFQDGLYPNRSRGTGACPLNFCQPRPSSNSAMDTFSAILKLFFSPRSFFHIGYTIKNGMVNILYWTVRTKIEPLRSKKSFKKEVDKINFGFGKKITS